VAVNETASATENMPTSRRRRRRRRWLIALAVVVVVVVWGVIVGVMTLSAYHHDRKGLAVLEEVKANLSPGTLTSAASIHLLDQAQAEFSSAQSELSSPLFAPIAVVPVIGRQYRAVKALSSAAGTVSAVGSSFVSQVQGLLDQPHGAGPERVASLRRLGVLSLSAEHQLAQVNTGPSQQLVGPLASKYNEFVTQLYDARLRLTKSAAVSAVVANILQGPQTYLVLAANNAEMRAGSGTFLEAGTASTADGSLTLGGLQPSGNTTLPAGVVEATGQLEHNWGWLNPGLDLRNLGTTPQFDVSAPLAARIWTASTGQQIDGVLALDVVGLRQMLVASGPVVANGQVVDAANVEQFLFHDQYVGVTDNSTGADERVDALGSLASAVLRQLQSQNSDLRSLANALSSAVTGRHLMVWSKNPVAESAWTVSGVAGTLAPRSVDVSLINIAGNKLDQFVPIDVAVSHRTQGSGTAVTMTIKVSNQTPPGEPQYVAGPFLGSPLAYGDYGGALAVNVPGSATHISMSGLGPLAVRGGEGPTWVLAAPVSLDPGTAVTGVVRFTEPGVHGTMEVVPSARVPPEQWRAGGRTFEDTAPTTIAW